MIRLVHPHIDREIEFGENTIQSLVLENPDFFYEFTADILSQISGYEGTAVLSSDYTPIGFAKNADLISCFLPFDINRKTLLGKINGSLEAEAIGEGNYARTQQLISELEKYFYEISDGFPCELTCEKLSVSGIIKMFGARAAASSDCLADNILDYMELTREFDGEKLFIFVNLRSYISYPMMNRFAETVMSRKQSVLLIDNIAGKYLKGEIRITVDNDLCEI